MTSSSLEGLSSAADEVVVHLSAEYWPYARTGGLSQAVRGIACAQATAGTPSVVLLPLYSTVRQTGAALEPWSDPFPVQVADRVETARAYRLSGSAPGEPTILFLENEGYFGREGIYGGQGGEFWDNHLRFGFFCMAALRILPRLMAGTTVLHAHDWHTALALVYLRTHFGGQPLYDRVATVLTVHNAAFQGEYPGEALGQLGLPGSVYHHEAMERYGRINVLKGGLAFSDMVTTVSPTHALELRTSMGGFGLDSSFTALGDRMVGVLNGIDYRLWDPALDPTIAATFQAGDLEGKAACKASLQSEAGFAVDPRVPLVVMIARLAEQKGFDLLLGSRIVQDFPVQWIFMGEGEWRFREGLEGIERECPDKVSAYFDFSDEREHRLMAGADLLLMPSLYEPCGLSQLRAQRYGTLPVVRWVGGLADTVDDALSGFVFEDYHPSALADTLHRALETRGDGPRWQRMMEEAMRRDFSWDAAVSRYGEVYKRAVRQRRDSTDSALAPP